MADGIRVNRAPVLTLWGVVVAERLGFDHNEALSLARISQRVCRQCVESSTDIRSSAAQRPTGADKTSRPARRFWPEPRTHKRVPGSVSVDTLRKTSAEDEGSGQKRPPDGELDEKCGLGKCLAGLNAQSKGRSLGIYGPPKGLRARARKRPELGKPFRVELCGRPLPAVRTNPHFSPNG